MKIVDDIKKYNKYDFIAIMTASRAKEQSDKSRNMRDAQLTIREHLANAICEAVSSGNYNCMVRFSRKFPVEAIHHEIDTLTQLKYKVSHKRTKRGSSIILDWDNAETETDFFASYVDVSVKEENDNED